MVNEDIYNKIERFEITYIMDSESLLADHGVRKYDYDLARFTCPDPLWEKYYSWTPYQYALDNPVSLMDGNGYEIPVYLNPNFVTDHGKKSPAESAYKYYSSLDTKTQNLIKDVGLIGVGLASVTFAIPSGGSTLTAIPAVFSSL